MIFLQGLEKVQVTSQTESQNRHENVQTNRASAVFNQTVQTPRCYQICWLSRMLSWLQKMFEWLMDSFSWSQDSEHLQVIWTKTNLKKKKKYLPFKQRWKSKVSGELKVQCAHSFDIKFKKIAVEKIGINLQRKLNSCIDEKWLDF